MNGDQDADRQHHDRHQRAAHMQQEHDAHQCDDERFPRAACACRVSIGAVDQVGAVIHRPRSDASGRPGCDFGELCLHVSITSSAFCAEAHHDDAAHRLAVAVQFGKPAPLAGPTLHARDVAHPHRRARSRSHHHDVLDVARAAQVARGRAPCTRSPPSPAPGRRHRRSRSRIACDHLASAGCRRRAASPDPPSPGTASRSRRRIATSATPGTMVSW